MNHILKEIDYCERHAQYSPIKIYAGDIGIYSLNCSVCLNADEASKEAPAPNLSRPKKVAKPLVIEAEQVPILPISNS